MNKNKLLFFGLLLVLFLGIFGAFKFRWDLTQEKRYTLSESSEKIIKKITSPLVVEVYLEGDFPASFKQLQKETQFMLEEFRRINPKLDYKFIDPVARKIPKDTLEAMGMQPSILPDVKDGKISQLVVYPFAIMKYKNQGISIPLISQQTGVDATQQLTNSIENLEYNLVSNIASISQKKKKNIGVIINQDELSPDEFQSFMELASENYAIHPIIPKNFKELTLEDVPTLKKNQALVIAKPRKAFTDSEKLILDQYIINGGKTLWMIDAVNAEMDSITRSKKIMAFPQDINMTDFFFHYGISIHPALVKDVQKFALLRLVAGEVAGNPQYMSLPWPYFPLGIAENNNPITKNINPVKFEFPTSIDTLGRKGITTKVLFESSPKTLQKQVPNYVELKEIATTDSLGQNEKPSTPKIFAVALEGKFSSAYAARSQRNTFPNFKANANTTNKMIVIADGDVGRNKTYKGEALPLGVDMLTNEQFGNEQFLRNALDYLLDDENLIELRNRNIENRLLDRARIEEEKSKWQWINLLLPLVLFGVFAAIFFWIRKRKFS